MSINNKLSSAAGVCMNKEKRWNTPASRNLVSVMTVLWRELGITQRYRHCWNKWARESENNLVVYPFKITRIILTAHICVRFPLNPLQWPIVNTSWPSGDILISRLHCTCALWTSQFWKDGLQNRHREGGLEPWETNCGAPTPRPCKGVREVLFSVTG